MQGHRWQTGESVHRLLALLKAVRKCKIQVILTDIKAALVVTYEVAFGLECSQYSIGGLSTYWSAIICTGTHTFFHGWGWHPNGTSMRYKLSRYPCNVRVTMHINYTLPNMSLHLYLYYIYSYASCPSIIHIITTPRTIIYLRISNSNIIYNNFINGFFKDHHKS